MKTIIIKTTLLLLSLFLVLDAAEAQMNLNEIADAEPFHKVAQIKGTENLLRDYFFGNIERKRHALCGSLPIDVLSTLRG